MASYTDSKDELRARYGGKSLNQLQVSTPAVVLDLAKLEANCNLMLDAVQQLDLSWRAHIKAHKTVELTSLQVGDDSAAPVNICASTVVEAEAVLPLLKEYQECSRKVNILFAFPIYGSSVDRLASISTQLGPGGLSVLVDHPDQLKYLTSLASKSGNAPLVFLKVDVDYGRAGVKADTPECAFLIDRLLLSEALGTCVFLGLYGHAGHSYSARKDWQALDYLGLELDTLQHVAQVVHQERPNHPLVLSVGATPTATVLQHPEFRDPSLTNGFAADSIPFAAAKLRERIMSLKTEACQVEVHAGVYPLLDLQQLAAHSRDATLLNAHAIAISVLVEVASLYPGRGPNGTTEALINAGCLALGREPCEDRGEPKGEHYGAWGLVMPWQVDVPIPSAEFPAVHGGWQVSKLSQEHGILRWRGKPGEEAPLYVGQRLRIWPNHACVTGAGFSHYLIVDSRGAEDEIIDVWPRANGW